MLHQHTCLLQQFGTSAKYVIIHSGNIQIFHHKNAYNHFTIPGMVKLSKRIKRNVL